MFLDKISFTIIQIKKDKNKFGKRKGEDIANPKKIKTIVLGTAIIAAWNGCFIVTYENAKIGRKTRNKKAEIFAPNEIPRKIQQDFERENSFFLKK